MSHKFCLWFWQFIMSSNHRNNLKNTTIEIRNTKQYRNANFQNSKQKRHDTTTSRNISKSWGKSAGVGRHFICHRYWWGIKPRPTRNKPEFIENLPFLVLVIHIFVICICFEFRYSNFVFPLYPQIGETYEFIRIFQIAILRN